MSNLFFLLILAQDARDIIAEVQKRASSISQKYVGTLQVQGTKGKIADKKWESSRLGAAGQSRAILRFTAPAEVKGVALLIVNHPDRASDQWMWTPSVGRERRIALQDRSTRFFGTDFSFEDLEERDVEQYDYKLLGEEQGMWKLESRPRHTKASQYTVSRLWIRKDHYTLAQVESYKGEELLRRVKYSDVENVQNIWTPRTIEIEDTKRKSRTILKLEKLQYNLHMTEADFTLQALKVE